MYNPSSSPVPEEKEITNLVEDTLGHKEKSIVFASTNGREQNILWIQCNRSAIKQDFSHGICSWVTHAHRNGDGGTSGK